ncbi:MULTISPECIES: phage integrase central domain-containing protein [unclassified Sphingomonas]|uniref:tyrosine-type recombinase/integrase n=1 Tax=unclassified Sphingomonas TaxID=196159 RepID=UPI0028629A27|nr:MULTISPECIES: integrase arm-type DNA-binding domain-containing protein [unclassified Sphingomonas]MDR6113305.1 integrase [Sphingomonas sp. SORGH_AS_0789]MDR6149334.1 integrase [Sphingomonas sp. SORGH_AS_0742]
MGRAIHKLSARRVETVKEPGKYGDGGGLWLRVGKDGSRRWVLIWQRDKRTREMGLGSVADVPLAQARQEAEKARTLIAQGLDPIAARTTSEVDNTAEPDGTTDAQAKRNSEASTVPTFKEFASTYINIHESGWKNAKHRQQWRNSINTHASNILDMPVNEITADDVAIILSPIWQKKPETASRVRSRIETILDAAKAAKHIPGPWENPARWRGNLIHRLPAQRRKSKVKHHAAMPFEDLPSFYGQLRTRNAVAARALELTILCATRTNETLKMTWGEVDLDTGTWTIPKERMKMEVEHAIPLSTTAIELLKGMAGSNTPPSGQYVFPGEKEGMPLSQMAMTMVLRRMNFGHFTVHGMRSAFSDYMGDMTDFPDALIEQSLAHQVGSEVRRAYRRRNAFLKRRALMEHWAQYVTGTLSEQRQDAVEPELQAA